ncbi:NUDIX domain-containing protein [Thermosporothrix hazakensis]|jgi:8-oxo-dGTP pyrophosphatase MutT (NUDIX family)|uniref:NUDIX domain-containing protein n=2 Tax=Thermosporothrix TaxID=768650 RepID=A0A326TZI0_THEHA|nr:NUDIX hydrolase [Thermosporothrix hazakensis]PZW22180.1 NUDIX domain-containing protein [Thermosporothrix hazakensis]BBH89900.1 NUDIX hydrolase [Thermosporothrix sp. COM3]GCE48097.1 NUDIX hydrolase [Thermosporothrix hazakensis]
MEVRQSWKTLSYKQLLDSPYLRVRSERVQLPDNKIIDDYFIIENFGWVGIVPVTEDGRFLLNRQYKHGIGQVVIEFPAGMIDPGEYEQPLLTAQRELMEETGYSTEPEHFEPLAKMIANPTGARTRIWWYLARNVRRTGAQKLDPAEEIENFLVTPAELLHLLHSGEFPVQGQIAAAYMALERLGILRSTL